MPTSFAAPRQIFAASTSRASLAMSLISLALPVAVHAQAVVSATSYVYQYLDSQFSHDHFNSAATTINGCFVSNTSSAGVVAADAACSVLPVPNGAGTLSAHAVSQFDPLGGTLKSLSSIVAGNFTLKQFVPTFDSNGNQTFSDGPRPDAVGATSSISLSDILLLNALPGVTPATINLFLDFDGTLRADAQLDNGNSRADNFINFCVADFGICGTSAASTQAFFGGSFMSLRGDGTSSFNQQSTSPAGTDPVDVTFVGSQSATSINGRITFAGIPISDGSPFDFEFAFGTDAAVFHSSANIGHIPDGCSPDVDPTCVIAPDDAINGATTADFYNTLKFAGFQVLDANGNDITGSVQLNFASGLNIPAGAPIVGTPEPSTFVLFGTGASVLGVVIRRRRNR